MRRLMPLSRAQKRLLAAIAGGATLKSHRFLNGEKVYQLHILGGPAQDVPAGPVVNLMRRGYLQSNQKFPAATLLLSAEGEKIGARLLGRRRIAPLSAGRFGADPET